MEKQNGPGVSKQLWLSYDLGIDGDYDGLYAWLDEHGAVECGDRTCHLKLNVGSKEPPAAVLAMIKRAGVKLRPKDRLYLIWRRGNGAVSGRFIAGSRHRAPWAGYAELSSTESEDVGA